MAANRPPSSSSSQWTIPSNDTTNDAFDTQHFRVTAGRSVFAARRTTLPDGNVTVDIAVPARAAGKPCIMFTVNEDETDMVLQHVHYEEQCALDGGLKAEGGPRATRNMIRVGIVVAIRLIEQIVPDLSSISFSDKSGFPCRPVGEVLLAAHNMLLYGSTWYERVLPSVVPYRPALAARLDRMRQRLAGPVAAPFDAFWNQAFGARATQRPLVSDAKDGVQAAYHAALATDAAASWNAVFREINKTVGCFVFLHVIETLMRTTDWPLALMGEAWLIDLANTDAYDEMAVIIEPLDGPTMTGGGDGKSRSRKLVNARKAVTHGIVAFQQLEELRMRAVLASKRRGRLA